MPIDVLNIVERRKGRKNNRGKMGRGKREAWHVKIIGQNLSRKTLDLGSWHREVTKSQ